MNSADVQFVFTFVRSWIILLSLCLPILGQHAQETPHTRPWTDYRVIMWVGDTARKKPYKLPVFFERLREMGVTTAMVYGSGGDPQPLLDNQFPYYVENIINKGLCLKFNSRVRDWDAFVTTWAKSRDEASLVREYSFDDRQWLNWAKDQMRDAARRHGSHQPLAYDIRDELSVTISANPFDYDFSPVALEGFRAWLKTQYPDLPALNAEWETRFNSWEEVKPFTTDEIKARMASTQALPQVQPDWQALQRLQFDPLKARAEPTRWNFSPWCDFRTYMDLSLARTLDALRAAAHEVDPLTPVGIEGTQMPHPFGGYDLWRLSQVLDWVEPYDIGNAREIFGSFMPGKPILTTVFETDTDHARRRLWHLLLEGDRGCIIWWSEDCIDWNSGGYALTPKGKALAPVLKEMTSPLAQLFLRAKKEYDPIAIHYSQPSIQADWLLESTVDGSTWLRRFSSFEAEHNRMARLRNGWLKALQDLGYSPRFVSSHELENGLLTARNFKVLVLPASLALSDAEFSAVKPVNWEKSAGPEGRVFYDSLSGQFDQHGKLRRESPFGVFSAPDAKGDKTFVRGPDFHDARPGSIAAYGKQRLAEAPDLAWAEWLGNWLHGIPRQVTLPLNARTCIHCFKLGSARLLAFERNVDYHMSEDLRQAGGNESLEKPTDLEARLAAPAHVYELRTGMHLGRTDRIAFTLDPWQPSLFAVSGELLPEGDITARLLRHEQRR